MGAELAIDPDDGGGAVILLCDVVWRVWEELKKRSARSEE